MMPQKEEKSIKKLAVRYFFLAFVMYALVIGFSLLPGWRHTPLLNGDAITYYIPAQNLLEHGVFSREQSPPFLWEPYRTPGYPTLIAFVQLIFGKYEWVLFIAALTAATAAWSAVHLAVIFGGSRGAMHVAGCLTVFLPNSLGLSAQLLTDALAGHLFVNWLFFMVKGLKFQRFRFLWGAFFCLLALQSLKPTFNTLFFLILALILLTATKPIRLLPAICTIAGSFLLPLLFAIQNHQHHGIFSASLLGVETMREYLMVRALVEETGKDYEATTREVRKNDRLEADRLTFPTSPYGRLYNVKKAKVQQFFHEQPITAVRLAISEMLRQWLAPQEFLFQVFTGDLPRWGRFMGSMLSMIIWLLVGFGCYKLWLNGNWQISLLAVLILLYFLGTASISHLVGARLRFPADMALIPIASVGLEYLFQFRAFNVQRLAQKLQA